MSRFRSSQIWQQLINRPCWRGAIFPSKSFSSSVSPRNSAWSIRRSFCRLMRFGAITTTGATLCVCSATLYVYSSYTTLRGFDDEMRPFRELANRLSRYYILSLDPNKRTNALSAIQNEDPSIPPYFYNPFISISIIVASFAVDLYVDSFGALESLVEDYLQPLPDKLLPDTKYKHGFTLVPLPDKFLPDTKHKQFTLVLDLNETLVSSDWSLKSNRGGKQTIQRPGLDAFLQRTNDCGYEVVLYTDEVYLKVGNLLYRKLKIGNYIEYVQTRGSNKCQDGKLYRDLSRLNRDPSRILYVSGHALENCLQPENCVPIKPWNKQVDDTTLTDLLPFLEYVANERPDDIRSVLSSFKGKDIATEFIASKYEQT